MELSPSNYEKSRHRAQLMTRQGDEQVSDLMCGSPWPGVQLSHPRIRSCHYLIERLDSKSDTYLVGKQVQTRDES